MAACMDRALPFVAQPRTTPRQRITARASPSDIVGVSGRGACGGGWVGTNLFVRLLTAPQRLLACVDAVSAQRDHDLALSRAGAARRAARRADVAAVTAAHRHAEAELDAAATAATAARRRADRVAARGAAAAAAADATYAPSVAVYYL